MAEFIKKLKFLFQRFIPKSINKLDFDNEKEFIDKLTSIRRKNSIHRKCHLWLKNNKNCNSLNKNNQ